MSDKYKVAIITGASSGIGASISEELCKNGTIVYALARSKKNLDMQKSRLKGRAKSKFIVSPCDISKRAATHKLLESIYQKHKVDLVVCNAGIGKGTTLEDHSWTDIDKIVGTNLLGTINVIKSCLMHRQDYPTQFVCTTSLAGKVGFPNLSIYSATKFAIEGLVESLRNEYKDSNISFTILRPGITNTAFFDKAGMKSFQMSVKNLRSFYDPERVAKIFLKKLNRRSTVITIGNDKYYLAILPLIPFKLRFRVLDIINRI